LKSIFYLFAVLSSQTEALLHTFDRNGDGVIDYNEFITFYPEAKAM